MAIVRNEADDGALPPGQEHIANVTADPPYVTHNRTNAGEPNGSVTPAFAGEIVLDTTNNAYWKAMGTANNTWVALTPPN